MPDSISDIAFDDNGLVSAAIQDTHTGDLLMVGYMNRDALEATRTSGFVHFWSRSRQTLWKKGETSGHVQRVAEMRINCELNSLLIEVEQVGAVCHEGYDTCYYRRIEPDGSLTVVRDRRFDPRDVYGTTSERRPDGIASITQTWWKAFEWLRDHDLASVSSTSRRLRSHGDDHPARVADELRELAGVLDGTHRHDTFDQDLRLEAGQVLYWLACAGVRQGYAWDDVHPDLALGGANSQAANDSLLVKLLTGRAAEIETSPNGLTAADIHDTLTLVGSVVASHDILPESLVVHDLDEMRGKTYLAAYFSS